ncbi:MAG: CPBP family intramembrane metalloprotease [Candidatus Marinimicrobia bacterium]|nr:CPBP family intramembrane metalloprotease [Candidatus Neomarinimicrobiota bacterium]MCF7840514.1 CPBP family intramembrane metalloprotease [Candidatus Neomarinimicrobiota bacterium]
MKLDILSKNEALLVAISCLFTGFFASGLLHLTITQVTDSPTWENVALILGEAAMILPILYVLNLRQQRLRTFIPRKKLSPVIVTTVVVFAFGMLLTLDGLGAILDQFFTFPEWLEEMEAGLLWQSTPELILLIAAGVIVAPAIEELIFRGFLQQAMAGYYQHLLPAIVAPAVLFTIFHVQYLMYLPAAIELLLLALAFGWVMGKTGSLLAPILLHALNNLASLIWLGTAHDSPGVITPESPQSWGWFILGLFLLGIAGWRLNREPDYIPFPLIIEGTRRPEDRHGDR